MAGNKRGRARSERQRRLEREHTRLSMLLSEQAGQEAIALKKKKAEKAARQHARILGGLKRIRKHLRAVHDKCRAKPHLKILSPKTGTPWRWFVTFDQLGRMPYDALGRAFYLMENDDKISRALHPRRLSRIAVGYSGPASPGSARRVEREWTVGRIGPWEVTISHAAAEYDAETEDSVTSRYSFSDIVGKHAYAKAVLLWLSVEKATNTKKVATRPRRRDA